MKIKSKEWVDDQIEQWLEHFANHVTTDPMGDYFQFRKGAQNLVQYLEEALDDHEEEG